MLTRWGHRFPDVWSEMARVTREMDRLLGQAGEEPRAGVYPALNLFEDGESFVVRAELPGADPQRLEVSATGKTLTIAGERERLEVDDEASAHRRERSYGRFRRAISLPQPVEPDGVEARYELGVLHVTLPKAEEAKPRKIEVAS